jgi:hypothetical protein
VGSERAPRRTHLKAWPGLGRLGRGSSAVAVAAAVWWRGEQRSGEGEAQGGGGIASGGPGAATYSEEKGEERRMAGRHGGGVTAELGGGAVRVAARERAGEPRDRAGEGIRRRMDEPRSREAALAGWNSRNGGGGAKNRGAEGRLKTTGLICKIQKF